MGELAKGIIIGISIAGLAACVIIMIYSIIGLRIVKKKQKEIEEAKKCPYFIDDEKK